MKSYKNRLPILLLLLMILLLLFCACGGSGAEIKEFSFSNDIDENGYWEGIRALDYVELFDYNALKIPSEIHLISTEALQGEISGILADYNSEEKIYDRAIVSGDVVNINYIGTIDGIEFDDGSTGGMYVTAGEKNYLEDFLTQIVGHKPGETINIAFTFSEDYSEDALKGREALFVTTINFIVEYTEPELTDDFVLGNFYLTDGWTTVAQMREELRQNLKETAIMQYIKQYLADDVTISSLPNKILKYQEDAMATEYQEYAEYYDMDLKDILSNEGYSSLEDLISGNKENNIQSATYYLVAQAVAEDLGLSVSEKDIEDYFSKQTNSSDYSFYEERYGLPYIKQNVLIDKVIEYIYENAVLL